MDKKRILLIEDKLDLAETIKLRLEANNYEVLLAADGKQGLDKVRNERPDLVILDLMLPKIEGYQVCRMLKFDKKYKKIPIIILTARAQDSDRQLAEEVGADAYLIKPYEPQVLLTKISELIH
ncbi:MAG: response regulator [Candidatus Omnitrophica bacterium]|nr:response regulator [Candidatus Omnitrophota bacterium]